MMESKRDQITETDLTVPGAIPRIGAQTAEVLGRDVWHETPENRSGTQKVTTMRYKILALLTVLSLLAIPAHASAQGDGPGTADLPLVEQGGPSFQGISAQDVANTVQNQLPQAAIASLLADIDRVSRSDGSMSAADTGRIEDELARQKQIWYEAYRKALLSGNGTLDSFSESEGLGEDFDSLFEKALGSGESVTPESLRAVYLEYDRLSQSFQQLKLARFLSGNRDGVSRYKGTRANRLETAQMADEIEADFLPGYARKVQTGVTNLRKVLVVSDGSSEN